MAHNHWPVGSQPQLYLTSVCYSWSQSDGRGCPTRSEQWGHAYRYACRRSWDFFELVPTDPMPKRYAISRRDPLVDRRDRANAADSENETIWSTHVC